MTITIGISDETWRILNQMKNPGQSFDELIQIILQQSENMQKSSAGNNQGVEVTFLPHNSTPSAPSQSKQMCKCGHPIDNHIEQVNGKVVAGECSFPCDCKKYKEKKK
jgi:predicted CopG family antitoxin